MLGRPSPQPDRFPDLPLASASEENEAVYENRVLKAAITPEPDYGKSS